MNTEGGEVVKYTQRQVNDTLRRGILFSLLWLMGIGSAIAIVQGLRARRMIRASGGSLRGLYRAELCLWLGWIGVCVWGLIAVIVIYNKLQT